MAEQGAEPLQYMPQDEDEALALLQGELSTQAAQYTAEAQQRAPMAMVAANTLNTQNDLNDVLAQASTVIAAPSRVITNETLRKNKEIARYPAGTEFHAQGNVMPSVDANGDIVITNTKPTPLAAATVMNNTDKVAAAVVNTPSIERTAAAFNLDTAREKVKTLSGDDRAAFAAMTISNIDLAAGGAMQRIRQAAALESGYMSAKAAYDRELLLDQTSGFAQRYGQASGQTIMAQKTMAQTLQVSQALERSLINADSELRMLNSAKDEFTKMELREAQKQQVRADRREQKREDIAELVSTTQLANFRYLRGTTGDDVSDSIKLVAQQKNDKALQKLINADDTNIHQLLIDADPAVQNGAKKLFLAYEKAANSRISKDATDTETTKLIDKALKDPNMLLVYAPSNQRDEIKRALTIPKSSKEHAEAKAKYLPNLLAAYVENEVQGIFTSDVKTWTGTGMQDPKSPFAATIKKISATSPDGKVPIRTFYDQFIQTDVTDATGKKLDIKDKIGLLTDTINSSVLNLPKNLLINADAIETMRIKMLANMKIDAATAFIRSQNLNSQERLMGQTYLYSKEFKTPSR